MVEVDPPVPELKGVVEPINIRERASKVGHGIVLVSDMHEGVDWKAVARELIHVGEAAGYLCHVLDLRELQRLVSHSAGRPAMLERYLTQRWQLMV